MSGHALDSPDRLEWCALFFQVQGGEALPERLCEALARRAAWTALERAAALAESGLRAQAALLRYELGKPGHRARQLRFALGLIQRGRLILAFQ